MLTASRFRIRCRPSCRSGTWGRSGAFDSADLETLGAEVVLANTYHLMLRPRAEVVAELGGLHRFTGWVGHTLTDSGGFQVHSLRPTVDDDGVTFRSVYDGSVIRMTPESAVEAQGLIGADIQMVLDVCATIPATPDDLRLAEDRTAAWAARARRHHARLEARPEHQALFGIVQGGTDAKLRAWRAPGAPSSSTSTATASAACRWGSRGRRCSKPSPSPSPSSPTTAFGT